MNERKSAAAVVVALWLCLALLWGATMSTNGMFYRPVSGAFHTSRATVSMLSSVLAFGLCGGSLVSGWLLGRFDARRIMMAGTLLLAAAYLCASQAASFQILLACHVLMGLGVGICTLIPVSFVIGDWFEKGRVGLAMGITMTGAALGGSAMVMVVGYFISKWGWRWAYFAVSIPMLLVVIPILTRLQSRPPWQTSAKRSDSRQAEGASGLEVAAALRRREFWLIALTEFLFGFVTNSMINHLAPYIEGLGYSTQRSAAILGMAFALTSVGKIALGLTTDWIGSRWAVAIDFLVYAASMGLLMGAARPALLMTGMVCWGLSFGVPIALLPLLIIQSLGLKCYGAISALISLAFTAGNFIGPIVVGRIFDLSGSYTIAFVVSLGCLMLAAFAGLACRPLIQTQAAIAPLAASVSRV
ncbi:MAG TPA: MFS transporter [Candidatus Binataceae bacterium]|nr:MFS transporter [Candidatus Binataceae bacterium]